MHVVQIRSVKWYSIGDNSHSSSFMKSRVFVEIFGSIEDSVEINKNAYRSVNFSIDLLSAGIP